MRWFIVGQHKRAEDAKAALLALGDTVSARWMSDAYINPDDEPSEEAMQSMEDIAKSDGLVYVTGGSAPPDEIRAAETALGMSLAFSKRVVIVGRPRTSYHQLPTIERYKSLDDFIQLREDEKNVG